MLAERQLGRQVRGRVELVAIEPARTLSSARTALRQGEGLAGRSSAPRPCTVVREGILEDDRRECGLDLAAAAGRSRVRLSRMPAPTLELRSGSSVGPSGHPIRFRGAGLRSSSAVHVADEIEMRELEQLDCLQQLWRHDQGLALAHLQPLQQTHQPPKPAPRHVFCVYCQGFTRILVGPSKRLCDCTIPSRFRTAGRTVRLLPPR